LAPDSIGSSPRLTFRFFVNELGKEPVRDWLMGLPKESRIKIGRDMKDVQDRWPVSKPLVDGLGGGLYEVRTSVGRLEYRVLFCLKGGYLVALHGFAKKTQRTPRADTDLALKRMKTIG
jgi:phage-related protein